MAEPTSVRDYRRLVGNLLAAHPLDAAMGMAVGGEYDKIGDAEAELLVRRGLRGGHYVIDLGCGSGRLSSSLTRRFGSEIEYLGTDVVPELLAYAKPRAASTYRFAQTDGLSIPAPDGSADFVAAFSLFTHLRYAESSIYLNEAYRVLRPCGVLVFSFLELWRHRQVLIDTFWNAWSGCLPHRNTFFLPSLIPLWARRHGFLVEGREQNGQTVAVLRKRTS
jgi:ubiquinone/menaquinone biosynthesis C-methylase UbiE